ncbi:MAG: nuclear transport factor 2 family protein [Pseudomonadota bacterium]
MVLAAYGALATLDRQKIAEYWHDDMVWLVPGHNPLSGWYYGLDAYIAFMTRVAEMSANSFVMKVVAIMTNDNWSTDLTNNLGNRAGMPDVKLDIDVAHSLHWKDGKVIAGKGAIFGDGTDQYDHFWSARPTGETAAAQATWRGL